MESQPDGSLPALGTYTGPWHPANLAALGSADVITIQAADWEGLKYMELNLL